MTAKELRMLRKAVRNVRTNRDTFHITNGMFSCRWNGSSFTWTYPSGRLTDELSAEELLKRIPSRPYGDKRDITSYCFDYGNDDADK